MNEIAGNDKPILNNIKFASIPVCDQNQTSNPTKTLFMCKKIIKKNKQNMSP